MALNEQLAGLAAAILDGDPIDWVAAESNSELHARPVVTQLRVLAALADLHRNTSGDRPTPAQVTGLEPTIANTPRLWGHLRLVERIGRGSFGEVYLAWDTRLDREVALKLLRDGGGAHREASAIIHEGRLLARVRHPNVVTIYGADQIGDSVGLWMEFVPGRTLEQMLDERKTVTAPEAVRIGVELCRAVSAVHRAGLLHRDIKTQNVMRAEDGRIVLMDFGTGKDHDDSSSDLAGTPLYLAPEVLEGQSATVRSDIYSLGVVLYRLVTGAYPVHAPTVRGVRRAHERGDRTAVQNARPDLPAKLARVIERAIEPRAERRYESIDAVGADLSALLRRPMHVRLAYTGGVAAGLVLVSGVSWELAGRQVGSSKTPSALIRSVAGLYPIALNTNVAERPVIAVLPFENLSAEPDSEYFVDGLTEGIIRNLAVVQGLEVRSRTSSFAFNARPRNLHDIGRQLGANLVVEGSVLRVGNRLRISAQLVQILGEIPVWTDRFDREVSDVFSIQDEISRAIVRQLHLTEERRPRRAHPNLAAYDLYLKACALVDRRGIPNVQKAAELFQRAITMDPEFAAAHAGLANAYAFMSFPYRGMPYETTYPTMRAAAVKALQLDALLSEAHAAMGWVYSYEHDWGNAEKSFQHAIRLDPSLTQNYTSYSVSTLQALRKYDEALRLLQVAARNDPLSLDVQREIGEVQFYSGRYTEAVDTFHRASEVEPDFPFVQTYLARALMFAGRPEEALPRLDQGFPWLAHAYVVTGRRAEAEKLAAEWAAYPYRLSVISAALEDTGRAVAALEQVAVEEPHRIGRLLNEPELGALRDHPRVVAVRRKFALP